MNDLWARRFYLAYRASFDFDPVRWDALQECQRHRWRLIAGHVDITEFTNGKALITAWSFDLFPKPWEEQKLDNRQRWQRVAGYLNHGLRRDVEQAAA